MVNSLAGFNDMAVSSQNELHHQRTERFRLERHHPGVPVGVACLHSQRTPAEPRRALLYRMLELIQLPSRIEFCSRCVESTDYSGG
ncbi:hypothetical protein BDW75DRAFT_202898 [Aspergillus navahoensis]